MQFSDALYNMAGSKAKARVLCTLAAFPGKEWSGRSLAIDAGVSQPQAWKALNALSCQGIVESKRAGQATMWKFNEGHVFADSIKAFARPKRLLCERLRREIKRRTGFDGIARVVLFGSVARGSERTDSDIDLFVEVARQKDMKRVRAALTDAALELREIFGSPIIPVFYTTTEVLRKRNAELLREIEKDGVVIYHR
jgi:predicted nucleotidyltransferase